MARTYSELYPAADIIILESSDSVGGVWSSTRLYPGLKTNNLLGTYENPDFPMTTESFGVKPNNHITGPVVHDYLHSFAKKFNLLSSIRFGHKVEQVEESSQGSGPGDWKLTASRPSGKQGGSREKLIFTADKLVVAAGVTNSPNLPHIPGSELFQAPIYHAKDFYQRQGLLQSARRVVVYGGAKSAWDGVYAYATAGVQVDWVMRQSGRGPCWMAPATFPDGSKFEDVAITRMFSVFGPCLWKQNDGLDWLRWLLHCTVIGNWIVNLFWRSLEKKVIKINNYDAHPETEKLKPWNDVFWSGTSLSILNYPTSIFDLVRSGRVKIHHCDVTSLSKTTIHCSNGIEIADVDALHCSTGWKHEPPIAFSPPSLAEKLGLPAINQDEDDAAPAKAARDSLLRRFPRLRQQPNVTPRRETGPASTGARAAEHGPYQLYRYTVPPLFWEKRNICFLGKFLALGQPVAAQCQALWASAYLEGKLPCQSGLKSPLTTAEITRQTHLQTQFHRLRYPASCGTKHPEFTFDTVPLFDLLLNDLGLKTRRKSSWWTEMTEPYKPGDYEGLIEEWSETQKAKQ